MATLGTFHVLTTRNGHPSESTMANNRLTVIGHDSALPRRLKSARVGIRTRVSGMKTHHDGPSYTTRATNIPRSIGLMRGSVILPHQVGHPTTFSQGWKQRLEPHSGQPIQSDWLVHHTAHCPKFQWRLLGFQIEDHDPTIQRR